jgi:hypothetical protein
MKKLYTVIEDFQITIQERISDPRRVEQNNSQRIKHLIETLTKVGLKSITTNQ